VLSLSRWRPRHLLLAWAAYWLVLLVVTLGPAVVAALRLTSDPNAHGNISANFGDSRFSLTIARDATTIWQGSAHVITIALWVGIPPLVLWALWVSRRSRASTLPLSQPSRTH